MEGEASVDTTASSVDLPAPFGPEQSDDFAGAAIERHPRQRAATPEMTAELVDGEIEEVDAHAAAPWPPSASRSR